MRNKRFFFIVFEGFEGSGKTYQSKKLFTKIKKKGFKAILTREPGGTKVAEKIRKAEAAGLSEVSILPPLKHAHAVARDFAQKVIPLI